MCLTIDEKATEEFKSNSPDEVKVYKVIARCFKGLVINPNSEKFLGTVFQQTPILVGDLVADGEPIVTVHDGKNCIDGGVIHSFTNKKSAERFVKFGHNYGFKHMLYIECTAKKEDLVAVGEPWPNNCPGDNACFTKITIPQEEFDRAKQELGIS